MKRHIYFVLGNMRVSIKQYEMGVWSCGTVILSTFNKISLFVSCALLTISSAHFKDKTEFWNMYVF